MKIKILALAAAATVLAAGAAHAQDYGAPPYASGGYGYANYNGGDCEGFTIAGAHAGVTVLGINIGGGARARIGDDCGGYHGGGYAPQPQPVYQGYQDQGYQPQYVNGGYYNAPSYAQPAAYPYQPAYAQPVYAQPSYGYAPQPCGCQAQYGYAQPY